MRNNMDMQKKTITTYQVNIYLAGNYDDAVRACKQFCKIGLCVTVERCEYVYTGGAESGVKIGLLNYPKFPKEQEDILMTARKLSSFLLSELYQDSVLLVAPDITEWISFRKA
jgi:glycerol-3-phosphate cytidylyltransferase-like family protein